MVRLNPYSTAFHARKVSSGIFEDIFSKFRLSEHFHCIKNNVINLKLPSKKHFSATV